MKTAEEVLAKISDLVAKNVAGTDSDTKRIKSVRSNGDSLYLTVVDEDGKERGFNVSVIDSPEEEAA